MRVTILGAGQVGSSLAENLTRESNDVTVVDIDAGRLKKLQERLDIRTVNGSASWPSVLEQAGTRQADLLIAVTNSDEVNMVACQITFTLFGTPTRIARIRQNAYLTCARLFSEQAVPINVLISPEQLITNNIRRLIEHPGALQVLDFSGGRLQLVAVRAHPGGPLVNQQLCCIRDHMPNVDTRVAAIFRREHAITPRGDTVIEADDEVFFIADHRHIRDVMSELIHLDQEYKRIIIVGGGNIGLRLAQALENDFSIKIIEQDASRCHQLSRELERTMVFHGDASDRDLLESERIEDTDVFIALTNDDEANIMASMLAKRMGARKVIVLINNPAYVDLVQGGDIDIAISPQQVTIGSILRYIRQGDVVNVHSLRRGAAEAFEAIAHANKGKSRVVGKAIGDIELPCGTTIGAIVRGNDVFIAHDDIQVEENDHVVLFLTDKKKLTDVEKLFRVSRTLL
ncbi:MAG: Trk system potassium transporter TrkA [Kistimonas sp.]|nr:Trk system potassium transporter TrkA [Kistimonas sp.]